MTKYIIAVAVGAILASFSSQAATKFKDSSVLSSGKWIKIKVGETGVYEITGEQLKQFGFSDPQKVKIFGTGGIQTTDNYNKDYTDDLEQVPAMRTGDKLYFYANGLTYEEIRSIDYTTNFDIYRSISKTPTLPLLTTSLQTARILTHAILKPSTPTKAILPPSRNGARTAWCRSGTRTTS